MKTGRTVDVWMNGGTEDGGGAIRNIGRSILLEKLSSLESQKVQHSLPDSSTTIALCLPFPDLRARPAGCVVGLTIRCTIPLSFARVAPPVRRSLLL